VSVPPQLQAIAECESHGNPRSIGGGGLYRGKYQMTTSIWASVGGHGDPAAASEREQDLRAALLYNRSGAGQWPVCGQ
jgi:resuscitation-promoting factor RpfB